MFSLLTRHRPNVIGIRCSELNRLDNKLYIVEHGPVFEIFTKRPTVELSWSSDGPLNLKNDKTVEV